MSYANEFKLSEVLVLSERKILLLLSQNDVENFAVKFSIIRHTPICEAHILVRGGTGIGIVQ